MEEEGKSSLLRLYSHKMCRTRIKLNFHKNYSHLDSIQSPNGRLVRTADVADDTFSFSSLQSVFSFNKYERENK